MLRRNVTSDEFFKKIFSAYSVPMYIRIACPNVVFCIMKGALCRVKDGILQCKRPSFGGQYAAYVRMNGKELYGKSTPHIKSGGVLLHYYLDCRYIVFSMSCVGHGACCCLLL